MVSLVSNNSVWQDTGFCLHSLAWYSLLFTQFAMIQSFIYTVWYSLLFTQLLIGLNTVLCLTQLNIKNRFSTVLQILQNLKIIFKVEVVQPYSNIETATAWNNIRFISSAIPDLQMLMAVLAFSMLILTSFSVDEILLARYVKLSSEFKGLSFNVNVAPSKNSQWKYVALNTTDVLNEK